MRMRVIFAPIACNHHAISEAHPYNAVFPTTAYICCSFIMPLFSAVARLSFLISVVEFIICYFVVDIYQHHFWETGYSQSLQNFVPFKKKKKFHQSYRPVLQDSPPTPSQLSHDRHLLLLVLSPSFIVLF